MTADKPEVDFYEGEPPTDPNHPVNQTPEDAFAAAVTGEPA